MAFKKPKKEKKSRLKDIEELLKTLDKGRLTEDDFEFITESPEGMVRNPISTMEFRDYNQNGIEDREEGLFLPRDFVPEDSLRKGPKPIPFPEMRPKTFPKPIPFPERKRPKTFPKDLGDILFPEMRPKTFPKPIPFPERKRPTPSFKDLGDILRERELIEVFDKELGRNVFVSKIKVLEDEGRYSPTKRAGGGVMNINTMTEPLGYREAGEVGIRERIYDMLAPNEKMSDEELRLQGINPDSVLPEERPQAEGRPEGVLQGLFRELIGAKKAEGSTLSDDAIDMRILGMKLELQEVLPLSIIDEMETMSVDEIIDLHNKTFGN